MELRFLTVADFDLRDKAVFARIDINVPMDPSTQQILDDTRIRAMKPTFDALSNAKVVAGSHQSRPGKSDFTSLQPHYEVLKNHLSRPVKFVRDVIGPEAMRAIQELKPGEVLLLDNLRLLAEENLEEQPAKLARTHLVQKLAPLFDVYVNDAFATAHRSQASLVGFPHVLPSCAGPLMSRELDVLRKLLEDAPRPATYVLGGAKVEDKVPVIENILSNNKADRVFVGGIVSRFFLKAVGRKLSKADEKAIAEQPLVLQSAKQIVRRFRRKILIPTDYAVSRNGDRYSIAVGSVPRSSEALDIGDNTIGNLVETVRSSRTVVASGPLGVFEQSGFEAGTRQLLLAMAGVKGFTVIGGGHLAGFAGILGIGEKFSHVSTAGGAMLSLLAGKELPAVRALVDSAKRFGQAKR